MKIRIAMWTCLLAAAAVAAAQDTREADEGALTPADEVAIIKAVSPSLVRVEYTLRFDKGESPRVRGWAKRCPNCGSYHGVSGEETISEERPLEVPGLLLAPDKVLTADLMTHPRFIKSIAVRAGEELVPALPAAYGTGQNATFLKLAKPLTHAKPLEFDAEAAGPYLTVQHLLLDAAWTTSVRSLSISVSITEYGRKFIPVPSYCLIVDDKGTPVGVSMKDELSVDDSWKGSPLKWETVSAKKLKKLLANVKKLASQSVLRVALSFRSPKKGADSSYRYRSDDNGDTERNVTGLLVGDKQIMVLTSLKPKVTARLERIVVHPAEGEPVPATFAHTLTDYGCFVATLERSLPGAARMADGNIRDTRGALLLAAEVKLQGENRVAYFDHARIASYEIGWKRHVYPEIRGGARNIFLFDAGGALVALPVARRQKVTVERSWSSGTPILTSSADLVSVLGDLAKHSDASNVPLTEEEENRLAWLGVVLQPLNKELARINKVSKLTRDGSIGAMVSYVYPGSPAAKAGVEVGYIIVHLKVEGHPKPLDVVVDRSGLPGSFPWDRLDRVPEQYYDQIPKPWPPAENNFTRALTELGFGKKYTAQFVYEGKIIEKDFTVTQSPPHYDMAPKYKSKALGLTVRELTYEVRRYFQKLPEDEGLIIAKIEPGSKASVAGLKPYEIITHVNDKPVRTVKDFERLSAQPGELRLSVMRWTRGRLVKIRMDKTSEKEEKAPTTQPASQPAEGS